MQPINGNVAHELKKPSATAKPVVANAISLDPDTPLPYNIGSDYFRYSVGKRYIPFGLDDNLPNLLWEARMLSATQNACIASIAQSVVGDGLYVTNVDDKAVDEEFWKWIAHINTEGNSLDELAIIAMDSKGTDGNAWVEIVKGEFGTEKYVKVYVKPSLDFRFTAPDKNGRIWSAYKSSLFREHTTSVVSLYKNRFVEIPLYSPNPLDASWKLIDGDQHTAIHLKNQVSISPYYGLPKSGAGLRYQILEGKAAQYNIDNFDNNMVLSAILVFKAAMTQEEAQKNAQEIIKTHTGQGKMGRVGVISSEGGIEDFTYNPLNTQKEGSFIEFDKHVQDKIISTHNWDSVLAGFSRDSAFGNGSQYVRAVFDVKKAMLLKPESNYLIQKFIKPLVNIAADHFGKPAWKGYEFAFKHSMPFSFISDIDVNSVLTKDEGREILGQTKLEDEAMGKQFIKSGAPANIQNVPGQPAQ